MSRNPSIIGQILRKDWKLFWPHALVVAAVLIGVRLYLRDDLAAQPHEDISLLSVGLALGLRDVSLKLGATGSLLLAGTAAFLFITLVIQDDAVSDARSDWLARPIPRNVMFLSKAALIIGVIHVPVLVADMLWSLFLGFTPGQAAQIAAAGAGTDLVFVTLPLIIIAALTDNLYEASAGALAGVFAWVLAQKGMFSSVGEPLAHDVLIQAVQAALVVTAALVLVPLQYFRRKTRVHRLAAIAILALLLLANFLPNSIAYAAQNHLLSPQPATARQVAFRSTVGGAEVVQAAMAAQAQRFAAELRVLELRFMQPEVEIPPGWRLEMAAATGRLLAADGETRFEQSIGMAGRLKHAGGEVFYYSLRLPDRATAEALKRGELRLEVEYHASLLRPGQPRVLSADGVRRQIPGIGLCAAGRPSWPTVLIRCSGTPANLVHIQLRPRDEVFDCPFGSHKCPPVQSPKLFGALFAGKSSVGGDLSGRDRTAELPRQVWARPFHITAHLSRRVGIADASLAAPGEPPVIIEFAEARP